MSQEDDLVSQVGIPWPEKSVRRRLGAFLFGEGTTAPKTQFQVDIVEAYMLARPAVRRVKGVHFQNTVNALIGSLQLMCRAEPDVRETNEAVMTRFRTAALEMVLHIKVVSEMCESF